MASVGTDRITHTFDRAVVKGAGIRAWVPSLIVDTRIIDPEVTLVMVRDVSDYQQGPRKATV